MRRWFGVVGLVGGLWLALSPFVGSTQAASPSSTGAMSGMGAMHATPAATSLVNASTYYWHFVPGALAILISLAVVIWSGPALARVAGVGLGLLAVWSAVGPFVGPSIGLGQMMMSGVTTSTALRHIAPGIVLAVAAAGIFFSAPIAWTARREVTAKTSG